MTGYGLYLARIVGTCTESDSRLQIRILPQMSSSSIKDNDCPRWSYFFRDELLTGKVNDLVWCIADDEFSNGYILGLANYTTYIENSNFESGLVNEGDSDKTSFSLPKDLKSAVNKILVDLVGTSLSFNDIKVTFWNDESIHFIERSTGGSVIAYKSGSLFVMRPSLFLVKINNATLKMDTSGFSVGCDSIKLQSDYVGLGKNPVGKVLTSPAGSSDVSLSSKYVEA